LPNGVLSRLGRLQIDGHYDKLRNVGEYIEDTEEYINIELDAGRNRLIRLDIVLTAASFAIAPFNLMAGGCRVCVCVCVTLGQ
jgi:uncharacterized Zn finger protein